MRIQPGGLDITLLPGRAALLPKSGTLIVADLHLGKSATFRSRGLAIPEGSTSADLQRLKEIIKSTGAQQIVIAGDQLIDWLQEIQTPAILTEGNHDRRSHRGYTHLPLTVVKKIEIDGIFITHDPADLPAGQTGIAGHLHPGVRIREGGGRSFKMECFHLSDRNHLVLPAFSEFTGTQAMAPARGDRFFVEIHNKVTELPMGTF
jgi:uncharacterized protein